jgi:hypothetical protein
MISYFDLKRQNRKFNDITEMKQVYAITLKRKCINEMRVKQKQIGQYFRSIQTIPSTEWVLPSSRPQALVLRKQSYNRFLCIAFLWPTQIKWTASPCFIYINVPGPVQSSQLLLVLASIIVLGFEQIGTHDLIYVNSKFVSVYKWGHHLVERRRGLTTTDHSPSTEKWLSLRNSFGSCTLSYVRHFIYILCTPYEYDVLLRYQNNFSHNRDGQIREQRV